MATPQRNSDFPSNNPNDSVNKPLNDLDSRRVEAESQRWQFGWGWTTFWIAVFIGLGIWFAGWGWGPYGGWIWGEQPHGVAAGSRPAATEPVGTSKVYGNGMAILNAANKQPYVGRRFAVTFVPIQAKVNDHTFWVGRPNQTPMLVLIEGTTAQPPNAEGKNIQVGERVDVTGTVERAPSANFAKQGWFLTDNGASRLQSEGVYVRATEVQKANP